jgi:hypothetical protein
VLQIHFAANDIVFSPNLAFQTRLSVHRDSLSFKLPIVASDSKLTCIERRSVEILVGESQSCRAFGNLGKRHSLNVVLG